jgi:hypothetical protein
MKKETGTMISILEISETHYSILLNKMIRRDKILNELLSIT